MKKRLITLLMAGVMVMSLFSVNVFAVTKTASNTEFGTLTGTLTYAGRNTKLKSKTMNFSTKIGKSAKVYASVVVKDYKTGKQVGSDSAPVVTGKSTSYYWEGHSSSAYDNSISGFGTHEARGKGSLAVYTTLANCH